MKDNEILIFVKDYKMLIFVEDKELLILSSFESRLISLCNAYCQIAALYVFKSIKSLINNLCLGPNDIFNWLLKSHLIF